MGVEQVKTSQNAVCAKQSKIPHKIFMFQFLNPETMLPYVAKGTLQMALRLWTSRWGNYPGLSSWAQSDYMSS